MLSSAEDEFSTSLRLALRLTVFWRPVYTAAELCSGVSLPVLGRPHI